MHCTALHCIVGARDPSWLSVAAAELLVYGDYFTLTARIASLPPTLAALLADILARLRRESPRLVWRPEPAAHEIRAGAHAANGGALRWIEARFYTYIYEHM